MLSFFPRGVSDEILNLIESVFGGFPSYSSKDDWLNRPSDFNVSAKYYHDNDFVYKTVCSEFKDVKAAYMRSCILTLKAPITIAADDIH